MRDMDAEVQYILDESLARAAIRVALPTIRAFAPAAAWGPRGAALVIDGPGLEGPVIHEMEEVAPPSEGPVNGRTAADVALDGALLQLIGGRT